MNPTSSTPVLVRHRRTAAVGPAEVDTVRIHHDIAMGIGHRVVMDEHRMLL